MMTDAIPVVCRRLHAIGLRAALYGSAALVPMIGGQALAQPAQDPSAADASDEIIVTAQRREERLEDVPMAVSVVSAAKIENAGIVGIHELGRVAPAVSVGFGGPFSAPAMRGITTLASGPSIENNVAIYIDGFYEPNPLIINQDLVNLASIEVLKGPQGTLYGRNATGGAILINTQAPSRTFTGKLQATYARFDDKRVSGYLSGPLSDGVRFSLAGYYRDQGGYLKLAPAAAPVTSPPPDDKDAAPLQQRSVRAKLETDLAPELTATLGYTYLYSDDFRTLLFTPFDHRRIAPAQLPPNDYSYYQYNYRTRSSVSLHQGTLQLAYHAGLGEVTSRTSFETSLSHNDYDFDGTYSDNVSSLGLFRQKTFQQAVDVSLKASDRLAVLLGGLYYHDHLKTADPVDVSNFGPDRVQTDRTDADIRTESVAFYVDATYNLTDQLAIDAGLRYSHEVKTGRITLFNAANVVSNAVPPARRVFDKATARASIRYEVAPGSNVYAAFSQGFRPGTFQVAAPAPGVPWPPSKSETINSYELGFKTAQHGFRVDLSAFYYDYKNLTVSVTVPNPNGAGVVAVLGNAPKAEIYGIDGQFSFKPADGLTVFGGAAWLHARYRAFPNAVGTGLSAAGLNVGGQQQDWSNQQMVRSPDFSGNIGFDYEMALANGKLRLSSNGTYSSSYVPNNPSLYGPLAPAGLQTKQRFRQGQYFLVNAQVSWTDPSDHLTLTVFGNNLTNKAYRLTYNGGFFGDYGTKSQPVTYGATVAYKF